MQLIQKRQVSMLHLLLTIISSSQILLPTNNTLLKTLTLISGTAGDNSPGTVAQVKLSIKILRRQNGGIQEGLAWDTTAIWFFVTSGTTSWTYNATPVSWNSGDNYLIQSKAEDDASNVETASVGISFIFDNAIHHLH